MPVWPVKDWIITNDCIITGEWQDYYKFNQVIPPITAVLPYVVSLLEQNNIALATKCATIDLTNVYFPIQIVKKHQKQVAFTQQGQQHNFTVLSQGSINSPALRHGPEILSILTFLSTLNWSGTLMTLCWLNLGGKKWQVGKK